MAKRGVAALVSDGVVRDVEGVLTTGLKVWAAGAAAPPSVAGLTFVDWQQPIGCGGVAVFPDDVIVADQGPGLSDEDQARVFEKFERLGRSGDGGSGLGLYISRRLARAMRGDLTVESAPGQGARFILEVAAAEILPDRPEA